MHKYTKGTGVNGVLYRFNSGRYVAQIVIDGKYKSKTFDTLEEAAKQRGVWENERMLHDIANKPVRSKGAKQPTCTENCRDCKYSKRLDHNGILLYCDYCTMENELRGCVAGDDCTKKKPRPHNQNEVYKKKFIDNIAK